MTLSAEDAARWLRHWLANVGTVDLTREEALAALDAAKIKGVLGRAVHDWLHACAANKAGADRVFTRDTEDFARLGAVAAWPD